MKYQDYYAILGVPRDADLAAIKKAYRILARKHHPDVSKAPDAESRFKEAATAYATLKDADKRAAYDALGSKTQGEEFAPPPQWEQWQRQQPEGGYGFDPDAIDIEELLAAFGRGGGGGRSQTVAQNPGHFAGRDYDHSIQISLEDAHHGTQLNLQVQSSDSAADTRSLQVTIPPSVREGQKLRLRGKGGPGRADAKGQRGADGDIYLHITLAPHPVFRLDHRDLYFDLVLSPWEAALGGDMEVPTLDGTVLLAVPPGSSSGRRLRLRGRGLAQGDLYAVVAIAVPSVLTAPERLLFEQLAAASPFRPRQAAGNAAPAKASSSQPTSHGESV